MVLVDVQTVSLLTLTSHPRRHPSWPDTEQQYYIPGPPDVSAGSAGWTQARYEAGSRFLLPNTGLLRQYFPKGLSFDKVTEVLVQSAVNSLNHRPRKILGFKTPFEVFFGKTMRYSASLLEIALRS